MYLSDVDTYKLYLSIKSHFTNDSYDFFRYRGNVKIKNPEKSLVSKPYFYTITKLSKKYEAKQLRDYFVSNMLVDDGKNIFDVDSEGKRVYDDYLRRKNSRTYLFKTEVTKVANEVKNRNGTHFWDSVNPEQETHPLLFRMFVGSYISPETMALLYKIKSYISIWDGSVKENVLYPMVTNQIKKFEPFVMIKDMTPFMNYISDSEKTVFG